MLLKQSLTNTTKKRLAVLFWLLSAGCMGVIFWFSAHTAEESNAQSNGMVAWLAFLIRNEMVRILIVRKSAHCMEYTGLCLLLCGAWYFTCAKKPYLPAVLCASLYAVTDEVHQLFVEGRSCELIDWAIDTFGALLGALAFAVLLRIIAAAVNKQKAKRETL